MSLKIPTTKTKNIVEATILAKKSILKYRSNGTEIRSKVAVV